MSKGLDVFLYFLLWCSETVCVCLCSHVPVLSVNLHRLCFVWVCRWHGDGVCSVWTLCYYILSEQTGCSRLLPPVGMLTTINNEPGFSMQAVKYSSWFKFTVCTLVIYTSLCSASTLLAAGAIYILVWLFSQLAVVKRWAYWLVCMCDSYKWVEAMSLLAGMYVG